MHLRFLTSTPPPPSSSLRSLKRHIHRLYKHIHPDRLAQHPHQQSINQTSFQILQSALQRHFDRFDPRPDNQTPPEPPPSPNRPQRLTFFTHSPLNKNPLKKSVVTFREEFLGDSIQNLFKALELEPPPKGVLPGRGVLGQDGVVYGSLTELFRVARQVEMAKMKRERGVEKPGSMMEDESLVLKTSLKRMRGVDVIFGGGVGGAEKKVWIMRRLMGVFRRVEGVDFGGLVVEIDGGGEVEVWSAGMFPWVLLGVCAGEGVWEECLRGRGIEHACKEGASVLEEIRKLEGQVGREIGVRLVMHNIGGKTEGVEGMLRGSRRLEEYRGVLAGIMEECEKQNLGKGGGTKSLVLMVEEGEGVWCEESNGVLRVGLLTPVNDILGALKSRGVELNARFEMLKSVKEAEEKLVGNVRRALAVESVSRGEISEREWRDGLGRLRKIAGKLRGVFDGMGVIVGTKARIVDSGQVEIPYDFDEKMKI